MSRGYLYTGNKFSAQNTWCWFQTDYGLTHTTKTLTQVGSQLMKLTKQTLLHLNLITYSFTQ